MMGRMGRMGCVRRMLGDYRAVLPLRDDEAEQFLTHGQKYIGPRSLRWPLL